jgi:TonB family protein
MGAGGSVLKQVVIAMVGAACAAPIAPTLRRCPDGHIVFANGADTLPRIESYWPKYEGHSTWMKRLKAQVQRRWHPERLWPRLGARTAVWSSTAWTTEVAVSLARSGHVLGVCVVSPSGSDDFDQEAVRAFWAGAPFRDPPAGIFESREHVTFPFGFYFAGRSGGLLAPIL